MIFHEDVALRIPSLWWNHQTFQMPQACPYIKAKKASIFHFSWWRSNSFVATSHFVFQCQGYKSIQDAYVGNCHQTSPLTSGKYFKTHHVTLGDNNFQTFSCTNLIKPSKVWLLSLASKLQFNVFNLLYIRMLAITKKLTMYDYDIFYLETDMSQEMEEDEWWDREGMRGASPRITKSK